MEGFINCVVEVLVNIFDMYIIYRYMTIFFEDKFVNKKLAVVMYGVRFVLVFVCGMVEMLPIASFLIYISSIFAIAMCYSSKLQKKIIVTILILMCSLIGEVLVAVCIGYSGFDLFGETEQLGDFYKIIRELIFWAATLIVQRFKNVNGNTPISKAFVVAIVVFPVSSIYLEIMIFQQQSVESDMAGISLLCVLTTNFILIYLYDSLTKLFQERTRAAIVEREKEYYHEQAEVLKIQHEELSQFRHDFKNRMVVIEGMINDQQYERVLEYTRKIAQKMNQTNLHSSSGNLAIDSVINYKLNRASEQGINVKTDIVLPECIPVDEDDIVVILGNLLDNAIEATRRLYDNKYILMDVRYDKGTLLIHIENSYDSVVYREKGKFVTRKKETGIHGIGLQSVNSIIEKYEGELEIEYNKDTFIVDVLLYI